MRTDLPANYFTLLSDAKHRMWLAARLAVSQGHSTCDVCWLGYGLPNNCSAYYAAGICASAIACRA